MVMKIINGSQQAFSPMEEDDNTCNRSIRLDKTYILQMAFVPSCLIIIILSFLQQRRHLRSNCCQGRPGVPLPLNFLDKKNRLVYVAGYSVTAWLLLEMMNKKGNIFNVPSNHYSAGAIKFLSCMATGVICYPIFGGITSDHWLGYLLGTIYVWAFSLFYSLTHYPCGYDPVEGVADVTEKDIIEEQALHIIRFIPCVAWFAFLCFYYPFRFFVKVAEDLGFGIKFLKKKSDINEPTYIQYVRQLFKQNKLDGESANSQCSNKDQLVPLWLKIVYKIYQPIPTFQFSVSILTAVAVSLLLVFIIALKFIGFYFDTLLIFHKQGNYYKERLKNLTNFDGDDVTKEKEFVEEYLYWVNVVSIILYVSLAIAFLLTTASLLSTLKQHRENLLESYKGPFQYGDTLSSETPRSVVVKSTRYVGYQFAYAAWGFTIQSFVFLILIMVVTVTFVSAFHYKKYNILLSIFERIGPAIFYIMVLMYSQQLIVHFCFLRKDGTGKKTLGINNRSCFINYQYFMVFASSALGLVSCLIRILRAIMYGLWGLPRLDRSTLSRDYEKKDKGFSAYVSFLKMESIHTNPTMLTFVHLLSQTRKTINTHQSVFNNRQQMSDIEKSFLFIQNISSAVSIEDYKRRRIVRNRWWVYITLANNLTLTGIRKWDARRNTVIQEIKDTDTSSDPSVSGKENNLNCGKGNDFNVVVL